MAPTASELNIPGFAFDRRWQQIAIWFLMVTTVLRLCQLSTFELAPDEAYYWDWSRRPALGYYDQGPFIAYLIRMTTAMFGTNEFGVRIGVLLASLGTLVCCYVLATRLYSPMAGCLAVLLLGCTPLMEVGSVIATYDPPLVFFWLLTLTLLERALFSGDARLQTTYWMLAGIAAGFGLLSKHTMVLLLPCLALFLIASPRHRIWLIRPQPYVALGIVILLYSGVIIWNSQHHWWTFGHLRFLTHKTADAPLKRLGEFVGSQALLLGPVLFVGSLVACVSSMMRIARFGAYAQEVKRSGRLTVRTAPETRSVQLLFLLATGLPVFLFFCVMTLRARAQGNWAAFAWITPTIIWSAWITEYAARSRKAAAWLSTACVLSGLVLTLLVVSPPLRIRLGIRVKPEADLTNTTYGWRELAQRVQRERYIVSDNGLQPIFLIGNGYQYCALLGFYLPDHPRTYDMFLHFRLTMYAAYVEELKGHLHENAVFVNDSMAEDADLRTIFERVEWQPAISVYRSQYYAGPIRTIYIARCYNYRLYTGVDWHIGG